MSPREFCQNVLDQLPGASRVVYRDRREIPLLTDADDTPTWPHHVRVVVIKRAGGEAAYEDFIPDLSQDTFRAYVRYAHMRLADVCPRPATD